MTIYKCDICKKEIKGEEISIRHTFKSCMLCERCAKPVAAFLKKHKLLQD